MAHNLQVTLDYGDAVELMDPADIARFGIMKGSVCGFRVLDDSQAKHTRFPVGTVLVLIESENGASAEIPHDLLRKVE